MKLPNCNACGRANAYYPLTSKPECRNPDCVNYNQAWAATCECCYSNPCKKPVEPEKPYDRTTVEPQHNSNDMDSWWRGQLGPYTFEYPVDQWWGDNGQLHGKAVVRFHGGLAHKHSRHSPEAYRVKDTGERVHMHSVPLSEYQRVIDGQKRVYDAWEADNS